MKDVAFWTSLASFFGGLILRANSRSFGWQTVERGMRSQNSETVAFYDQTGMMLMIFGLALALLAAHHYMQAENSASNRT